ncbi:MAG: hypothetical protein GXO79_09135 [Chlorobi bacterium]|nr:hypothetical protein [Chlorobiota bacterium]
MNFKLSFKPIPIIFIIFLVLLSFGCNDKIMKTYEANVPVYMSLKDWRAATFSLTGSQNLEHPGKIYVKDNYLFVNEYLKGVHIIDNTDPASPVEIGFLPVHANVDMAIKDNYLFLDSYYDLLTFNITDPANPQLVDREKNVFDFNNITILEGYDEDYPMAEYSPDKGIILRWEQKVITVEEEDYYGCINCKYEVDYAMNSSTGTSLSQGAGTGGSMARFAVYNTYLYVLKDYEMSIFSVADGANPEYKNFIYVNWQAETLFPSNNNLYVGTTSGMLIFSLSTPTAPTKIATYNHLTSCDPVVVYNNRAYATLSSGSFCSNDVNQLDVIDLSNISSPMLMKSYPMTNPKGLAIDNNTLFLCDGDAGLKVYDISDDYSIDQNLISQFPDINTYDVIALNNILIMTGNDGIYQYDYSDINNIILISKIPVIQ